MLVIYHFIEYRQPVLLSMNPRGTKLLARPTYNGPTTGARPLYFVV